MNPNLSTVLKYLYSTEGLKSIPLMISRAIAYAYYKYIRRGTFIFNGVEYKNFYHWYNVTFRNERCVEIALALELLDKFSSDKVLEVGNVLGHYSQSRHDIIDKYEAGDGVVNVDVMDFNPSKKYDLIISISTLEHVGYDETPKEEDKFIKSISRMQSMLSKEGKLFITMPFGWNPNVDAYIWGEQYPPLKGYFMKRVSKSNEWKQVSLAETQNMQYNTPFPNANGLIILEN